MPEPRVSGRYYCPTSGDVENPGSGGFDVCCGRPQWHVPVPDDWRPADLIEGPPCWRATLHRGHPAFRGVERPRPGSVDVLQYWCPGQPPVLRLSEVAGGRRIDRPVYVLGEVAAGTAWRAPAGPHAGHWFYLRKVRARAGHRLGCVECARCRQRWSFVEYDDPSEDPYRWRPPGGDAF